MLSKSRKPRSARPRFVSFRFSLSATIFLALLDRFNVGVAAPPDERGYWPIQYCGWLRQQPIFIAYYLFEIPSNIVLQKVGARIWITRIMVT
jgi:ACS family tartrate transporter-like MFS transporter